jgi:hypothetical protein
MQFDQLRWREFITLLRAARQPHGRLRHGLSTREKRAERFPLFWPTRRRYQ